ncbi:hypothetical protein V5O48_005750 [Marasmius crinis-equi]|uniref:Uncharacterized protein n=1 Tax=Marasmius crinis-equi TaxID=585013 RepID=A0ABR3FLG0_9AGAR
MAENKALKTNCWVWRRRAETHAAATIGLLNVARITKDRAAQLQREKEELERNYALLKMKLQEVSYPTTSDIYRSSSPESSDDNTNHELLLSPDLQDVPSTHWLGMSPCDSNEEQAAPTVKRLRSRTVDTPSILRRSSRRHHPYLNHT